MACIADTGRTDHVATCMRHATAALPTNPVKRAVALCDGDIAGPMTIAAHFDRTGRGEGAATSTAGFGDAAKLLRPMVRRMPRLDDIALRERHPAAGMAALSVQLALTFVDGDPASTALMTTGFGGPGVRDQPAADRFGLRNTADIGLSVLSPHDAEANNTGGGGKQALEGASGEDAAGFLGVRHFSDLSLDRRSGLWRAAVQQAPSVDDQELASPIQKDQMSPVICRLGSKYSCLNAF